MRVRGLRVEEGVVFAGLGLGFESGHQGDVFRGLKVKLASGFHLLGYGLILERKREDILVQAWGEAEGRRPSFPGPGH